MGKSLKSIKNDLWQRYFLSLKGVFKRTKYLVLSGLTRQNMVILSITAGLLTGILPISELTKKAEADLIEVGFQEASEKLEERLVFVQGNSLLPINSPVSPYPESQSVQKIRVVVTGYSSNEDQTDSDPFITAAGTQVREGIIANNLLPFGTKIRIPEIYGDKIFVVEDRMSWQKGNYHIDIWFPDYGQALNFGAKRTYIEVLEG